MSSTAEQSATQSATQGLTRTVSCTIEQKKRTFVNDGSREGTRTGTREGTRTGSRAGTLSGALSSVVAYDARVRNQINGFNLTGYKIAPEFAATGGEVWGDATFDDDYDFGDYTFGEVVWSGWQSEPGESPADCLGNNPGVTDLSDVTTTGDVVEGDVAAGDIAYGVTAIGDLSVTGPVVVSVNERAIN